MRVGGRVRLVIVGLTDKSAVQTMGIIKMHITITNKAYSKILVGSDLLAMSYSSSPLKERKRKTLIIITMIMIIIQAIAEEYPILYSTSPL